MLEPEEPEVDEEAIEEVLEVQPLSDEERLAGRKAELAKMDTFQTYTPVEKEEAMGKLILDSTWGRPESPQERQNAGIACESSRATAIEMMSMLWQQHQLRPS